MRKSKNNMETSIDKYITFFKFKQFSWSTWRRLQQCFGTARFRARIRWSSRRPCRGGRSQRRTPSQAASRCSGCGEASSGRDGAQSAIINWWKIFFSISNFSKNFFLIFFWNLGKLIFLNFSLFQRNFEFKGLFLKQFLVG